LRVLGVGSLALCSLLVLLLRRLLLLAVLLFVAGLRWVLRLLRAVARVAARLVVPIALPVPRLRLGVLPIVAVRAVLPLLVLLLSSALRLVLLRRRRRILREIVLHEIAVVGRVRELRIELERAVVGRDRVLEPARLRERVAAVVVALGRVDAREARRAVGELARAILRRAPPLRVLEQLRGAFVLSLSQRLVAALIGPLPEVLPLERVRARRRQQQGYEHARDPAAAEDEREQWQQREREPAAAVAPYVGLLPLGVRRELRGPRQRRGREQALEVAVVGREPREAPAARGRDARE